MRKFFWMTGAAILSSNWYGLIYRGAAFVSIGSVIREDHSWWMIIDAVIAACFWDLANRADELHERARKAAADKLSR